MLALLCSIVLHPANAQFPKLPTSQGEAREEHRRDRDDGLNSAVLEAAIVHRSLMPAAQRKVDQGDFNALSDPLSGSWQFIGPRNLDVGGITFSGPSPVSGRINAAAVDPFDSNTYYAGSGNGGFWKTTDSGINWVCLSDNWPVPKVSSIVCDWAHPGTIYVGTGDVPSGGGLAAGIMKTIDGGLHWTPKGASDFGPCPVSGIIVDPVDPNFILASTIGWPPGEPRVWRSTDGGDTWSPTSLPIAHWHGLVASAQFLDRYANYYATTGFPINQVWRSHDQSLTWDPITLPASLTDSALPVVIATSPHWPANQYLLSMEMHKA